MLGSISFGNKKNKNKCMTIRPELTEFGGKGKSFQIETKRRVCPCCSDSED